MEPPERGRQEIGAGRRAGADREGARPKPEHLARRLLGGAQQREGLAGVWLYHPRRRSRPDPLPVPLDESDAKVRFEPTQVLGDSGLADVAGLGGAAYPAMVQDGEEQLEAVHREAGLEPWRGRSEEHTSELQSPYDLVCRLLLEKKKFSKEPRRKPQRIRRHHAHNDPG